jgi:hypothetical protein
MPETLETLGAKLDALGKSIDHRFKSIDHRFDQVDNRFEQVDKQFEEMESRLRVKIEAVDMKASLAIERLDDLLTRHDINAIEHARFEQRLDNHEVRLTALENRNRRRT